MTLLLREERAACVQPEPRTSADDFSGRLRVSRTGTGLAPTHHIHTRPHASGHSRRKPLSPTTYQVRAAFPGLQ